VKTRMPSKLSDPVHHQLNTYALAAAAAGVGMLALSQPADAKIVYTKTHRVIGLGQEYKLDLNHDKITDFTFVNMTSRTLDGENGYQLLFLRAPSGNGPVGRSASHLKYASAMQKGSRIGSGDHFESGNATMEILASSGRGRWGQWYDVTDRYLGLEFKIKGKTHYGWARLSTTGASGTFEAALTGYAYETIPGKAIIAGKTKGPDVITVEPGSLGRLAQGSTGLALGRQK